MKLHEIKQAVRYGVKVYWSNTAYEIIVDSVPQFLIHCILTDAYWGLTWADGVTLNGKEEEFFVL